MRRRPTRGDGIAHADSSPVGRALLGALGGLVGTFAMTAAMRAMHRRLPANERYPLAPREIIEGGLPEPVRQKLGEQGRRTTTLAGHFAYGAATGAAYGLARRNGGVVEGALYGVFVWAASYLAEMPALGILEPAHRHPPKRNLLMIAAHLVWGGTLALAIRELELAQREIFATDIAPDRRRPHPRQSEGAVVLPDGASWRPPKPGAAAAGRQAARESGCRRGGRAA
jgi:uncharacterized membrane protein YagU involved in acid resistance